MANLKSLKRIDEFSDEYEFYDPLDLIIRAIAEFESHYYEEENVRINKYRRFSTGSYNT